MLMKCPFTPAVNAIATAIAALADWWGELDTKIGLMQNNPTVGPDLVIGGITEADFGGYATKVAAVAAIVVTDAATGNLLIRIPEPAGGWTWTATGTPPANSPQTIYGAYAFSNDGTKLLGVAKFTSPIIINTAGQNIDIGSCDFVVTQPPIGQ